MSHSKPSEPQGLEPQVGTNEPLHHLSLYFETPPLSSPCSDFELLPHHRNQLTEASETLATNNPSSLDGNYPRYFVTVGAI